MLQMLTNGWRNIEVAGRAAYIFLFHHVFMQQCFCIALVSFKLTRLSSNTRYGIIPQYMDAVDHVLIPCQVRRQGFVVGAQGQRAAADRAAILADPSVKLLSTTCILAVLTK